MTNNQIGNTEAQRKGTNQAGFQMDYAEYIPTIQTSKQEPVTKTPEQKPENNFQLNMPPASVVIDSKQGSSGFSKFIVLSILIILLIYAGVYYLYTQNKSLKELMSIIPQTQPSPTPVPVFDPDNINIENGNLVYENIDDPASILINKQDFTGSGISGISRFTIAPNDKHICFEIRPPSTKPGLYISDIMGKNSKLVSSNKFSCLWSNDSSTIFYRGIVSGIGNINIFMYDLKTDSEKNLTQNVEITENPDFDLVGLSSDESSLICSYLNEDEETKQCEINLISGEFKTF